MGLGPRLNTTKKKTPPAPPLKVESRVGIRAPAVVVWEILRDIERWPEWNPTYPNASGQIKIGAVLNLTVALPGQAHRDLSPKIIDWVPEEQILWADILWRGWANSVRFLELEQLGPASTIFSNGEVFQGRVSKWYGKHHRKSLRRGFEAMSDALKARAEAEWQNR